MKKLSLYLLTVLLLGKTASADEQELVKPSVVVVPALSYLIPGLGSFLDEDYSKGFKFLSYGATGLGLFLSSQKKIDDFIQSDSTHFHQFRDLQRERQIGQAMFGHSMMLSLYDSFSSRAIKSKANNEYLFLPENQNMESILKAPFKMDYLSRWTTLIPFSLAILVGCNEFNENPKPERFELRPIDGVASSYTSYMAGTGEEAFFRGWAYPVLYQNTGSHFTSNLIQGTAFGFAHGPNPYFQLAFGFYSGWLTQRNNFDLGESIFIHAWWDFWVITAEYARSRSMTKDYNFQLPPFQLSF